MFNIGCADGRTMLGVWVDHETAEKWLAIYNARYPAGKPYPNGRGFYPAFGFRIVQAPVV